MKIVLAYSGGLDTSLCIKYLQDRYDAEVVTLTLGLGQEKSDLKEIEEKAKALGAIKTYSLDVREEFAEDYVFPAIKANALYEGIYPLSTALSRPLIAKKLVEIARKEKADAVAHGCTGKGNDQVRIEVSIRALEPRLKIIAPAREWKFTRDTAIEYAKKHGIKVDIKKKKPYSIDENLWGRSVEAGPLEDPENEPDEDAFLWTRSPEKAPEKAEILTIEFENGVPIAINGEKLEPVDIISRLNVLAGKHGIGRIDTMEDRLIGIKSREVYECPAAITLLTAHRDLERLTLTREEILFKEIVEWKWSQMVYFGLWFEPLMKSLNAFIDETQTNVCGEVKLKLYKGSCMVVGRKSKKSLYDYGLATYDKSDKFDHKLAEGFIRLWGLQTEISAKKRLR